MELGERALKVFKKRQGKLAREKFPFLLLPQVGVSALSQTPLSFPLASFFFSSLPVMQATFSPYSSMPPLLATLTSSMSIIQLATSPQS